MARQRHDAGVQKRVRRKAAAEHRQAMRTAYNAAVRAWRARVGVSIWVDC
jgi:hypothetical protein